MCQTESGQAGKADKKTGQSKFNLRESLLADILAAIETAKASDSFAETLEAELQANADLRKKITDHRNNCLVAQRKILNSIPQRARTIVSKFINDLLIKGGQLV